MIIHAPVLPARPHDVNFTDELLAETPAGTTVPGDKGFISAGKQSDIRNNCLIILKTPLRKNMKECQLPKSDRTENRLRRIIETVNARLTERFHVQKIKARKGYTFIAKWCRKILTHTVCVFTNLVHGYIPTQIDRICCSLLNK